MRDDIQRWIADHVTITGAIIDFQVTSTATVLRVPSDQGDLFFKAAIDAFAHEAAVTDYLAARFPAHIPQVIAADADRNWLLTRDAGSDIRALFRAGQPIPPIDTMIATYARLQREALEHRDPLLARGIPDYRLHRLPDLLDQVLTNRDAMLIDQPDGMSARQYDQLLAFRPQLETLCQQLADFGIPETLHHDDFHTGNILYRDGAYRFVDWGESCITHPFFSLMLVLRYGKFVMQWDEAYRAQIKQAYLSVWSDVAPLPILEAAYHQAARLAALSRAITWYGIAQGVPAINRPNYAERTPYWLLVMLYDCPMEVDLPQD